MLESWLNVLNDGRQYCEPPLTLGPAWCELVEKSTRFETPYECAIKTDSLHNLGPLRPGEKQGIEHKCLLPHGISGTKHDATCATPGAAIRGYAQGQYRILCHTVNNGADCNALADDLEAAFPGVKDGIVQNVMCCIFASFNGFCKPLGVHGRSRGALRPGEKHGQRKQYDDDEILRRQFQGVIRLAKVMSFFRWAIFAGAGTGEIWDIDCNESFSNSDGGAQWNCWTNTAMQAFQALGIPVLPCCKIL